MNNEILKQLSFGFELEGFFKSPLQTKVKGTFKTDGSVHISNPFTRNESVQVGGIVENQSLELIRCCHNCNGTGIYRYGESSERCNGCLGVGSLSTQPFQASSEFASEIITDFDQFLAQLEMFDIDHYAWGDGCGFHLHLGKRGNDKPNELWNLLSNFEFLNSLQKMARTDFCKCQTHRLLDLNCNPYQPYTDKNHLISGFKNHSKYRFMRFHPGYHTLEFRFLAPCEHKAANARKLIEKIVEYIADTAPISVSADVETGNHPLKKIRLHGKLSSEKYMYPIGASLSSRMVLSQITEERLG